MSGYVYAYPGFELLGSGDTVYTWAGIAKILGCGPYDIGFAADGTELAVIQALSSADNKHVVGVGQFKRGSRARSYFVYTEFPLTDIFTVAPLPNDLDKATAALVYSSIPRYRNSDRCPKPFCGRVGYFKQMALCCDVHGAFHT